MRNFISLFFRFIAVIVTVWEFGEIALDQVRPILESSESTVKSILIISITVILLIAVTYFLYKYIILPPFRGWGLNITDKNRIVFEQNRKYSLSKSGPTCRLESKMIFLEEPKQDELIDIFDVYGQEFPPGFKYSSPDSVEVERIKKKSRVHIYWQPKNKIAPYIPYTHIKEYFMPDDYDTYDDGGYSFEIISDVPNGLITIEVDSHYPIEKAVVVKMPRFWESKDVLKYADQTNRTIGPPPTIDGDQVIWQGNSFDIDRRYSLTIFYEGYEQKLYGKDN